MKKFTASIALILLCSCSNDQRKVEYFAGDWETPPMSELLEIGVMEQIEALRNGTHPDSEALDNPDMKEILSLPPEEAKAKFMESIQFKMTSQLFAKDDPVMGFTISPPTGLTVYLSINGVRQKQEFKAEYELTSQELICRIEDGPTIFTISGENLITKNEKEGYPTQLVLHRASSLPEQDDGGKRDK